MPVTLVNLNTQFAPPRLTKSFVCEVVAPTRFYKYRSVSGQSKQWTESILMRNELFFATKAQFNDPFDCRPRFVTEATVAEKCRFLKGALKYARYLPQDRDKLANLAKGLSKENKLFGEAMQDTIGYLEERLHHGVGILCLSTKFDDILMWSHYADSHRGVCLAFVGPKGTCPFPDRETRSLPRGPSRL